MNKMKTKRTYSVPAGLVDPEALRKEAGRRRLALVAFGCSTYTIGVRGGLPGIVCLCCGLGSSHAGDVEERYCGFCQEFHSDAKKSEPALRGRNEIECRLDNLAAFLAYADPADESIVRAHARALDLVWVLFPSLTFDETLKYLDSLIRKKEEPAP